MFRWIGRFAIGMARQGFQVSLGDHSASRWIAVFYQGGGGHRPIEAAAAAQEATPWQAVQRAAWAVLR
jgi:hypothetical protein